MCSHYQALKDREKFLRHFDVAPPPEGAKLDLWPGYVGPFIRAHPLGVAGYETEPLAEALDSTVVPDPYYDGASSFEHVLDLVEDACKGLMQHVRNGRSKSVK